MRGSSEAVSFGTATQMCLRPDGTTAPCGPGNERCSTPIEPAPRFHIMDPSCSMNDPNGPVYDHKHGVYHVFFQDHLAEPGGSGPVYGHVASRDLVHWTHLPVALWNDQPYDHEAVVTGSATVVGDEIIQIYPGVCTNTSWPRCPTGTNTIAIAVPADPADPLLTRWVKPSSNPILNGTQRDPSAAWLTVHGEWRFTTYDASLYATAAHDLRRGWYRVGTQLGFGVSECPSLYPLPRATPGTRPATTRTRTRTLPTHVRKESHGWADWVRVGTYTDGAPGHVGKWTPWPWSYGNMSVSIDHGAFYASKDMWDPKNGGRRITWGWTAFVGPLQGTLSLPREVTWHSELQQLVHSPLPEQDKLRNATLVDVSTPRTLPADAAISLGGGWSVDEGSQSEVEVSFAIPAHNATFGVAVMADASAPAGMLYFVEYTVPSAPPRLSGGGSSVAPPHEVRVGSANLSISSKYSRWMSGFALRCCEYDSINTSSALACQQRCDVDGHCAAWTWSRKPTSAEAGACVLRSGVANSVMTTWTPPAANPNATSGVKAPSLTLGGKTDILRLSPHDANVTLRIYTDRVLSEGFWQGGRVVMTRQTEPAAVAGIALFTGAAQPPVSLLRAKVWTVGDIWVAAEAVARAGDDVE
jgi:sucrose-6-phosphate hydrolase SacC (GH32 family)